MTEMHSILPIKSFLQCSMIVTLVSGSLLDSSWLLAASGILACASTILEIPGLIRLARLFVALALIAGLLVSVFLPHKTGILWQAFVQGVSFAALMMVLGMVRRPVRRSDFVRDGTEYLLSFRPKSRYAAINIGSHFLSLLFNVGMIAMIGDLARAGKRDEISRRPLVLAGMRGTALVSIWSPIGLGFAIVTAGIPGLDSLKLMITAFAFSMCALLMTAAFPLLPAEASQQPLLEVTSSSSSLKPLIVTLLVCGLLLAAAISFHRVTGISFTLASVAILPTFTAIWLRFELGKNKSEYRSELRKTIAGLSDLKSESAVFMSANVIGAALSIALSSLSNWDSEAVNAYPILPVLLAALVLIPLAAAAYIPNSILVVMFAQLLGSSPIGVLHPLALGVTLCIAWAVAISVSPISAMSLITASHSGVSPQRVAWRWNAPFALMTLALAAATVTCLVASGY